MSKISNATWKAVMRDYDESLKNQYRPVVEKILRTGISLCEMFKREDFKELLEPL